MEVDAKRLICKVNTTFGKRLGRVKWMLPFGGSSRAGDRGTPSQGDRVVLSYGLGYPLIVGFLPELDGVGRDDSTELVGSGHSVDTGNFSGSAGNNSKIDSNKPKDFISGDRIFSTLGGALIGLLRGGSVLIRSGPFSEIFVSKLGNLVRVVSGNWEHFTDVFSDVVKNYRGRVYRYTGYSNTYLSAKNEVYSYREFTGDTALAEQMKTSYVVDVIPATQNDIIRKETVSVGGVEKMHHNVGLTGLDETVITNAGGVTTVKSNGSEVLVSHKSTGNVETIAVIDISGILFRTGVAGAGQKASFHIDQNGNMTVTHDGLLNVNTTGTATIHSEGNMTASSAGNVMVTAGGTAKVEATGKVTVKGATVDVDGGGGGIKGLVQGSCICAFTGAPHGHVSGSVKGSQ